MGALLAGHTADLQPLALGMLVWVAHFVWAMLQQSSTRRRVRAAVLSRLKTENGGQKLDLPGVGTMGFMRNHPRVLEDLDYIRTDRTFMNQVEQAPLLFSTLALYCCAVDVVWGGRLLLAYSLLRLLYARFYEHPTLMVRIVTGPNYCICLYMLLRSVLAVFVY